jgi:hypothetical protein
MGFDHDPLGLARIGDERRAVDRIEHDLIGDVLSGDRFLCRVVLGVCLAVGGVARIEAQRLHRRPLLGSHLRDPGRRIQAAAEYRNEVR